MEVPNLTSIAVVTSVIAYIGPGPGLSMLWALLGLLGTVLLAIVAVFFQPLRILWRRMRGTASEANADDDTSSTEAPEESDDADEDRDVA